MLTALDLVDSMRALSRAEYERIVATGMFEDDDVELIEGVIVRMPPPHGPEHDGVIHRLQKRLAFALGDRAEVRVQSAFAAGDRSEPEPDIAVVPPGDYLDAHPREAWLVIEVADSSLVRDRVAKSQLYASAGVPEYWLVDLVHRTIEVRSEPSATGYAQLRTLRRGESLVFSRFPEISLPLAELLR